MRLIFLSAAILLLILSIRFIWFFSFFQPPKEGDLFNQEVTLFNDPSEKGFYQTFRFGSILVQTVKYPRYQFGDKIKVKGIIEQTTFQSNGKEVRQLVVKNPAITLLNQNNLIIVSAAFVRKRIINTFNAYLPKNEAALLTGIVLGGSGNFSKDLFDAFQKAGVLHVVAASGMNVTMVAGFLFGMFNSILSRKKAITLSIIGVFYYTLLAGMSASVVRAAIMGSIVFTAAIIGRKNTALVSLFLTGFIMLMINPLTISDVSFQLSFLSTFGILMVKPIIDSLKYLKKLPFVSDDVSTSISAQVGSLPILAKTFSFYSLTSIFVNGLVLWTIPVLMLTGGIAAICSIALPFASVPFLYISYPLLLYFEKVVLLFASFPGIDFSGSSWWLWVGYYLILSAVLVKMQKRK